MTEKTTGRKKETPETRAERELIINYLMQDIYITHAEIQRVSGIKLHYATFLSRKKEARERLAKQEEKTAVQFKKLTEENPGFNALANFSENYITYVDSSLKSWHDWWRDYRESGRMTVQDMEVFQDALLKLMLIMKGGNENNKK